MKHLIVNADDFGLDDAVNEAVEQAYSHGILSSASLMVTAPSAADAVQRARRLTGLGVGLHLVLVDGRPALPPEQIPDLVGPDGRFYLDEVGIGIRLFFQAEVRRQAEAELRAQFELFRATGLPLDHVNGHHHFHQHPSVVSILMRLAEEFEIRAVRLPLEPLAPSWRAQRSRLGGRLLACLLPVPRLLRMRQRLGSVGIRCNDHMFGLHESGRMTAECIDGFLQQLPEQGVSEIYCHPATRKWQGPDALPDDYLCVEEFEAISDPERRQRLQQAGIKLIPFAGLSTS
jgi:hopanoid biosynthesis associated protein HpnK